MPTRDDQRSTRQPGLLLTVSRLVIACVAAGVVGLAAVGPRFARGDEGILPLDLLPELMPDAQKRALESLDPMPHVGVAGCSEPDVWLVSTRRLPSVCRVPTAPNLAIERFIEDDCANQCGRGRWQRSSLADLLGPDEHGMAKPLVIFIHGNRYDGADAKQQGLLLARHCAAACPSTGPLRTVIYSWPSDKDGILLRDGRNKYDRAYSEGRYMAWLLGQIDPSRPVGIVGYSFGALITAEALDDLLDAEATGRSDLQPWRHRPGQTNLMLIAPALRCDAFAPRGPYRHTLDCVDRMSLIINPRDKALEFFPFLDRRLEVEALGHTGMPRRWIPAHVEYSAINAENVIGKKHGLPLYLASPTLTKRLCTGATSGL